MSAPLAASSWTSRRARSSIIAAIRNKVIRRKGPATPRIRYRSISPGLSRRPRAGAPAGVGAVTLAIARELAQLLRKSPGDPVVMPHRDKKDQVQKDRFDDKEVERAAGRHAGAEDDRARIGADRFLEKQRPTRHPQRQSADQSEAR